MSGSTDSRGLGSTGAGPVPAETGRVAEVAHPIEMTATVARETAARRGMVMSWKSGKNHARAIAIRATRLHCVPCEASRRAADFQSERGDYDSELEDLQRFAGGGKRPANCDVECPLQRGIEWLKDSAHISIRCRRSIRVPRTAVMSASKWDQLGTFKNVLCLRTCWLL